MGVFLGGGERWPHWVSIVILIVILCDTWQIEITYQLLLFTL